MSKGFDEFGNPVGRAFDLGGVDDERLRGEKILLYVAYSHTGGERYEWHLAQQAVAERQMQMDIVMGPASGSCTLNGKQLSQYDQVWYVSSQFPTLTPAHVEMIADYVRQGHGLLIWADNAPYYADANLLAGRIVGTEFSGNLLGDGILTPASQVSPGHFVDHPLTQGVNNLYEGITICTVAPAKDLTILAQSHDGQMCMACFECDEQRVVLDTGFTKLHEGKFVRTAGTARYFRNIAFWLARASRGRQYTVFTPGRESIAMIQPGGESERYSYKLDRPTMLTYLLHWEGQATLGLVVQNPHKQIIFDASSAKAPIRCEVPGTENGDWVCWVKGVQVPRADFPYVLSVVRDDKASITGKATVVAARRPPPFKSPVARHPLAYTRQWGSTHPGCLIILLDQSDSMDQPFAGGQAGAGRRKADMVATIVNGLLNELIRTNTVGPEIKPRADIAVLGYEGGSARSVLTGPLTNRDFVSLPELMNHPLKIETRIQKDMDDEGQTIEVPVQFGVWVEPHTGTATPMCAALGRARELAAQWALDHPNNHPPVIINITDGASTDGDPADFAQDLCQVYTAYGDALLLNCHITHLPAKPIEFPSSAAQLPHDPEGLAAALFALSSVIPDAARKAVASQTGQMLPAGARGFIFNGDAASVRQMFTFATVAATNVDPNR